MTGEPLVIFETVHGSTAYGLNRAGSDVDLKGILIGPRPWYFGFETSPEQVDLSPDHVRYELRKFFRLAADANPTVLELLFTGPEHHRIVTSLGQELLAARSSFLSRRIADRFGGYALSQMKRIRTHRSHLLSPPRAAPTRADFGLPERTVIPADQLAAAEALLAREDNDAADALDVSPNFLELLARERRYKSSKKDWDSYQQWVRSRNLARSELEAKFGYDTKHAMHLIRLQRTGLEALRTGVLPVHRPDREELLAIRDGAWTFDELEQQAEDGHRALEAAIGNSPLPAAPNDAFLRALCISLIERAGS